MLYAFGAFLVLLGAFLGLALPTVPWLILGGICLFGLLAVFFGDGHGEAGPGIALLGFGLLLFLAPMAILGLVVRLAGVSVF